MVIKLMKIKVRKRVVEILLVLIVLAGTLLISNVFAAVPSGPSLVWVDNETSSSANIPTLESNADSQGGRIIILRLSAMQSNDHYKAYVGNVTGTFVLGDSANYSIYEWTLATVGGQVYATRTAGSITWADVECANLTHVTDEMSDMHHNYTNTRWDSLNDTFDDDANDHFGFTIGAATIVADSCNYSINTWVNDTAQTSTDWYDEVLLYDGSDNLIYATKIEDDQSSYRNDSGSTDVTYDFQIMVAENGTPGTTQTDYYFYVELS